MQTCWKKVPQYSISTSSLFAQDLIGNVIYGEAKQKAENV